VAAVLACGAFTPASATVFVRFQTTFVEVAPGDTFDVQMIIPAAADSFNAFDAPIRFDPTYLAFVSTLPVSAQRGPLMTSACSNTFHLFNARPDSLQITLSLLCNQTFVAGPGTIYQVRFRAVGPTGVTRLSFGPSTAFYKAGFRDTGLVTTVMDVQIGATVDVGPVAAAAGVRLGVPNPNPSRDGHGTIAFDLPADDDVRLELLDVQGRRVATLAAGRYPAGSHRVAGRGGLAPGVYRVRLETGRGEVRERRWVSLR
jgi:hypothetical protein